MSKSLSATFYDLFHQKSGLLKRKLTSTDFTYFYILNFLQQPLKKVGKKSRVLDIGCGVGNLVCYLSDFFHQVVGLDISPLAIKLARTNAKNLGCKNTLFFTGSVTSLPQSRYDLIICTEVIEHVSNDQEFITQICRLLAKNGRLLISTPLKDSLLYSWGWFDKFDQQVGHLRRYQPAEIIRKLENHGLSVIKLQKSEGLLRSIIFTSKLKALLKFVRWPLSSLIIRLDEVTAQIFGYSNIMIWAEKK